MRYEPQWAAAPTHDLRLISLVDPVMGDEIRDAANLLVDSPAAHGRRAERPFSGGMEYRFLVRSGITVRMQFRFVPARNRIVIQRLLLNRTGGGGNRS